jgi:hypothetical protein
METAGPRKRRARAKVSRLLANAMTRPVLLPALLLPAALLCLAAAPAPKTSPAKSPAKAAAPARPGPAKAAAAPAAKADAGGFDATNPQALMGLLGAAGANVQTNRREDDSVFVTVTSTAANFSMQFAGCTPQGRSCRAVLLDGALPQNTLTGAQINAFNQTSVMCRIYQAKAGPGGGLAHIVYSAILFKSMSREDGATHLQAWQGCLADAADFARDPVAYLANAA